MSVQRTERDVSVAYTSSEVFKDRVLTNNRPLKDFSGGLGVLSGDHLRAAADLGIRMNAVTLLYSFGYQEQHLDPKTGKQYELYPPLIPSGSYPEDFNLKLVRNPDGSSFLGKMPMLDRTLHFRAYDLKIGDSVTLSLLTTDIPQNRVEGDAPQYHFDKITGHLYGGDETTRLRQQALLGIGGYELLKTKGVNPTVYHLNEGHSAFINKARIEDELGGRQFASSEEVRAAAKKLKPSTLLTSHTIVPAAFDHYPIGMVRDHFKGNGAETIQAMNDVICRDRNLDVGSDQKVEMFYLGQDFAGQINSVSRENSDAILRDWGIEVPSIVNGVYVGSWMNKRAREFVNPNDANFMANHTDKDYVASRLAAKKTEDVRDFRNAQRGDLVDFINDNHFGSEQVFKHDRLTLAFARRFADYKRLGILFSDPDKLASILSNPDRPMQLVLAGLAHPKDEPQKEVMGDIVRKIKGHEVLRQHAIFIENYNDRIASELVKADVWVNNPKLFKEASGTSGMKAGMDGALQNSTRAGWVAEASGMPYFEIEDDENTDEVARRMYSILENQIGPKFYGQDRTPVSGEWAKMTLESMGFVIPKFSATRMVQEYYDKFYLPMTIAQSQLVAA